jgi:hypothetical protein
MSYGCGCLVRSRSLFSTSRSSADPRSTRACVGIWFSLASYVDIQRCTGWPDPLPGSLTLRVSPARHHVPRVEAKGFELLASDLHRRHHLSPIFPRKCKICLFLAPRISRVVGTFTRITALLLRSLVGHRSGPACRPQLAADPPALEVDRHSISLRTAGATSVPNSSMARSTFSCGIAPTLICAKKRL